MFWTASRLHEDNLIPAFCPDSDCNDAVPANPPPAIMAAFADYNNLIRKVGATGKGVLRLQAAVCMTISDERSRVWQLRIAKGQGWPINPTYSALPERVMAMKVDLDRLVSVKDAKETDCVWQYLLDELEGCGASLNALGKMKLGVGPLQKLFDASHPG
jgi:hypothetical protein